MLYTLTITSTVYRIPVHHFDTEKRVINFNAVSDEAAQEIAKIYLDDTLHMWHNWELIRHEEVNSGWFITEFMVASANNFSRNNFGGYRHY